MNPFFNSEVSLIAAFGAGVLSFISPCVLPIIPGYLSFISGLTFQELTSQNRAAVIRKVTVNTVFFILGFTVIFVLLGATASSAGSLLKSNLNIFNKVAGVLIVIFGLHIIGVYKIPFLNYEKRIHSQSKPL